MLEQFQPWLDYKRLIEKQANESQYAEKRQEKTMVKRRVYQTQKVQYLKIGRK